MAKTTRIIASTSPTVPSKALKISAKAMSLQRERIHLIAENLANAGSRAINPTDTPYRRKVIKFQTIVDKFAGIEYPKMTGVMIDPTPLPREYAPNDPGADAGGMVALTNVQAMMEMIDFREAMHSHEANRKLFEAERDRKMREIDLLK